MKRVFLFLTCMLWFFPAMMHAYTFSPSVMTLASSGNNSSGLFSMSNPEDRIIPIDITVYELTKDIDGKPVRGKEVIDYFIIYPSQFFLKPKEKRSVQIRWIGDPSIPYERAFTIFCREVPLPKKERKEKKQNGMTASINVLIHYAGRVYVAPRNARPDIVIDSVETRKNESGQPELVIICMNKGTGRGNLLKAKFIVTPVGSGKGGARKGASVELAREDIPGAASSIFVNGLRRFVIPWPRDLPFGPVKVVLKREND
ncbi:MAG: fimbria/pilus periplasmic chaperone [Deltaproteobacteria bacterium]|nr:fimbria/pilus periplasmic chaperone [Deltaproteobacteria bacterium]